jgi:hypothetical protein
LCQSLSTLKSLVTGGRADKLPCFVLARCAVAVDHAAAEIGQYVGLLQQGNVRPARKAPSPEKVK